MSQLTLIHLCNTVYNFGERNFKIAKGAVVCSEALLIGDITIGEHIHSHGFFNSRAQDVYTTFLQGLRQSSNRESKY